MNAKDLRRLLEKSDNKLNIFANTEILYNCDIDIVELFELVKEFLTDEEKLKLFDYQYFEGTESLIIGSISNENIKLEIIYNYDFMSKFENYVIVNSIKSLSDDGKKQILQDENFVSKYQFTNQELCDIVFSFCDEEKTKILTNRELIIDKLQLSSEQIAKLIKELHSDEVKTKILEIYELEEQLVFDIVNTYSNENKLEIILKEKRLNTYNKIQLLSSLNIETLGEFLKENKEFCVKYDIHPYEIIRELDSGRQKDFITKLENFGLSSSEKKEILVILNDDVKQDIHKGNFPQEYKIIISIPTKYRKGKKEALFDIKRNIEDYRELDNVISPIYAEEFTREEKIAFMELCDICPNLKIFNTIDEYKVLSFTSMGYEYKEAEEWITSIIDNIDPRYSKAQKMAIIDNAIGKKIRYTPDFDTERFNKNDNRALWKIISSGYGVCNGIAKIEQYMLKRIEIDAEIINSSNHAFLKIKDIELPLANGEIVKGNTILDPTWNLANHRFGGKPNNFCINYEQARKNDIDKDGKDHNCHKNDEKFQDATLNLDEQSLRQLFTSVGLADKEGNFPIKNLEDMSKTLHKLYENDPNQNIEKQFLLLLKICPEFASCQQETMTILKDICLNDENLEFNKCIINRVYDKMDKEKRPILYVYIDSNEFGKKFYFADKNTNQFIELSQQEFINQFECYEEDLKRANGFRPWETKEKINQDLFRNSDKIVEEKEI